MDDKIISTLKLKRALNSLKSKFISTKGGTMEGVFNVDTLYFKVNTASGYKQAFGTIRGGLLALGSDELPAALYGYNKDQKPQWVYKEGSNYVFKDLALKDDIYPVGAIYMSVSPTSPASLFGGTWTQWGSGRVPIGINSSDTDFNTVEKTGGEKEHTLTVDETPSHKHDIYGGNTTTTNILTSSNNNGWITLLGGMAYKNDGTMTTVGNDEPHNNLQPYITCYMWKRVS